MRTALFWLITQRGVFNFLRTLRDNVGSIFTGQESKNKTGNPSTGWTVISLSSVVVATNGVDAVGWKEGGGSVVISATLKQDVPGVENF